MMMMRSSSGGLGSSLRIACHDCGNQAKRDCAYMRCRTCCKTRGFRCQTHVKSTWVPAYRRRHSQHQQQQQQQEMQQQYQQQQFNASSSQQQQHVMQNQQHTLLNLNPRRDRAPNPTASGLEEGVMFPSEVTCPAIFRCVVVRSSDNVVEHYAYQTSVSIGGHLFKGILYDQGLENPQQYMAGEGPSSTASLAPVSATFGTPRTSFPSPFQIPLDAATTENPVSGTHVFFHQSS